MSAAPVDGPINSFDIDPDSYSISVSDSDSEPTSTDGQVSIGCLKNYFYTLFDKFSAGPFFATSAFFLVCLYTNSVAQVFTEKRVASHPKEMPILDLGFDVLPSLQGQREYADLFVVGACVASFVRFMPTFIRWAFLRRFLFFYGM